MNKVVVTGLGFVSSIGNEISVVEESLRQLRHGFEPFEGNEGEDTPVKLYGSIKGFDTSSYDQEDWNYPAKYKLSRLQLKTMSPHVLYSYCATLDAIENAAISMEAVSDARTGLYSASAGSTTFQNQQLQIMNEKGVMRCSPFCVVTSTVGTINFNLGAALKIKGAVCGMASACASSAHALGFAYDEIATGRQDRMIIVGAEDGNRESILPFAAMRALSLETDPARASCPFDKNRSGFVGTGGATAMILESAEIAKERDAPVYAEFLGWGQAADGYSPAISQPGGFGLARSMSNALTASGLAPEEVDYINAHGTSTPVGDLSEISALQSVFGVNGSGPKISSTKALTGHGLSMAGALEAAICCLAMKHGFTPGSAHIEELEPEARGLEIIRETLPVEPKIVLSNSSGFGGANVTLAFKSWED
ncbi:MAG: beta-ketoacyl-[acyl-carrier-protein] synthase family protein [Verrucomicrobiota bacterium]